MVAYLATEKDCMGEGGEAAECVICFEEFEQGVEMGRLECLCKFHKVRRILVIVPLPQILPGKVILMWCCATDRLAYGNGGIRKVLVPVRCTKKLVSPEHPGRKTRRENPSTSQVSVE